MAYMFSDVRHALKEEVESYSLIRPSRDGDNSALEYAKAMLEGESVIVDWSNTVARASFLKERRRVAESVA